MPHLEDLRNSTPQDLVRHVEGVDEANVNYVTVADHKLRDYLKSFESFISQHAEWPFRINDRRNSKKLRGALGLSQQNFHRLIGGIINQEVITPISFEGKRSRQVPCFEPDGIRIIAAVAHELRQHLIESENSDRFQFTIRDIVGLAKKNLGEHPLAAKIFSVEQPQTHEVFDYKTNHNEIQDVKIQEANNNQKFVYRKNNNKQVAKTSNEEELLFENIFSGQTDKIPYFSITDRELLPSWDANHLRRFLKIKAVGSTHPPLDSYDFPMPRCVALALLFTQWVGTGHLEDVDFSLQSITYADLVSAVNYSLSGLLQWEEYIKRLPEETQEEKIKKEQLSRQIHIGFLFDAAVKKAEKLQK